MALLRRTLLAALVAGSTLLARGGIAAEQQPPQANTRNPAPIILAQEPQNWRFVMGLKTPGPQGAVSVEPTNAYGLRAPDNEPVIRLEGYFGFGGQYVGLRRDFPEPRPVKELQLTLCSSTQSQIVVRITGRNGVSHQQSVPLLEGGRWQTITIRDFTPKGKNDYLTWSGDGSWDGTIRSLTLILDRRYLAPRELEKSVLWFSELRIVP